MKAKILTGLKYFAFFCVGLFLLWLSLRKQNLAQVTADIKSANYLWLIGVVGSSMLSNISRSVRWNMLIEPTGSKPRLINTFSSVIVGYFANLAIPRLGEVTRCVILNRYEKVPMDTLIGTVVVERIVDVISLFILLMLILFLQFHLLSSFVIERFLHPIQQELYGLLQKGTLYYFIVFGLLVILILIGWFAFKKFRETALYVRIIKLLKGFGSGLRTIGKIKSPELFLLHTVFIWTAYTFSAYFCFLSFDFSAHLGFVTAIAIMIFGGLGYMVPIPGAVGVYQTIITAAIMLYGLTGDQGEAIANLSWAAQTFAVIFFGILFYMLLPAFNRSTVTTVVVNEQA